MTALWVCLRARSEMLAVFLVANHRPIVEQKSKPLNKVSKPVKTAIGSRVQLFQLGFWDGFSPPVAGVALC